MRDRNDALVVEQRVVRRHRLILEHVEGRAREPSFVQRIVQRRLVHDSPARSVHQVGAGLHHRQLFGADHAARLVGERSVGGDDVRFLEQVGKRDELDPDLLGLLARQVGVVGDHAHPECPGALRHLRADAAGTGQAQRLSV